MRKKSAAALMAAAALCMAVGCTQETAKDVQKQAEDVVQEVADQAENIADSGDERVVSVKNGYPEAYPEITFGEAFDSFSDSPTWKYFESEEGENVVEFTGYCMYQDVEVKARLQFILADDGTFSSGALSFNDVPQSQLITGAMLEKAFEQYAESNGIALAQSETDNILGEAPQTEEIPQTEEPLPTDAVSVYDAAGRYAEGTKTVAISIYSDETEDGSVGNMEWSDSESGESEIIILYQASDSDVTCTLDGTEYRITFCTNDALWYDMSGNLVSHYIKTESFQP